MRKTNFKKKNDWIYFLFLEIKWQFGKRKKGQACGPTLRRRGEGLDWGFPFLCKTLGELGLCSQRGCSTERTQRGHSVCTWTTGTFPVTRRPLCFSPLVLPHILLINVISPLFFSTAAVLIFGDSRASASHQDSPQDSFSAEPALPSSAFIQSLVDTSFIPLCDFIACFGVNCKFWSLGPNKIRLT